MSGAARSEPKVHDEQRWLGPNNHCNSFNIFIFLHMQVLEVVGFAALRLISIIPVLCHQW